MVALFHHCADTFDLKRKLEEQEQQPQGSHENGAMPSGRDIKPADARAILRAYGLERLEEEKRLQELRGRGEG